VVEGCRSERGEGKKAVEESDCGTECVLGVEDGTGLGLYDVHALHEVGG
jgi:hypothetical protein